MKVQYRNADGSLTNNEGKPYLKIVNTGTTAVPYNQVTARYWITPENFKGSLGMWIDYAPLGNSKVIMKYVSLSTPGVNALGYIEYSFTTSAGSLAAGGNSGEIQSRYANTDWSTFNEANDHSIGTNSPYADKSTITLYRNGVLVWGTEPLTEAPVIKLKIFSARRAICFQYHPDGFTPAYLYGDGATTKGILKKLPSDYRTFAPCKSPPRPPRLTT
ncbi:cellulose binding domain-containing protein [Dawidia cretensis]|uniref:cellulose binding domain-containing protein n=1 Tax=Dawidia cretensis TaxID=2782350 RepID=UPI0021D47D10|nr:cellulose binding domain-containing protein [Dawidia cretensis]